MSQPTDHRRMAAAATAAVTISSQLMIAAIIFLFMVIVFIFFLYLYAKYYMASTPLLLRRRRSRARFIFAAGDQIPAPRRGLDAAVLKSLPITIFNPSNFKDGIECAVCLSELSEGEEARILSNCNHGFHVECIDMWLQSHITCPLCRAPVTAVAEATLPQPLEAPESLGFPTNVLFWGNQDQVSNRVSVPQEGSSSSLSLKRPEGMLVIDIPSRAMPGEELRSPKDEKTPKSARLRSFRRLLSRGKMVVGSSCSPRGGDIEQGQGSSLTPKTPTS